MIGEQPDISSERFVEFLAAGFERGRDPLVQEVAQGGVRAAASRQDAHCQDEGLPRLRLPAQNRRNHQRTQRLLHFPAKGVHLDGRPQPKQRAGVGQCVGGRVEQRVFRKEERFSTGQWTGELGPLLARLRTRFFSDHPLFYFHAPYHA